jgi:hypothetical protein
MQVLFAGKIVEANGIFQLAMFDYQMVFPNDCWYIPMVHPKNIGGHKWLKFPNIIGVVFQKNVFCAHSLLSLKYIMGYRFSLDIPTI